MDILMDNQILTKVNSTKYLGIIVDHKLNWFAHITYVKAKISKEIGIMYKAWICLHLSIFDILCRGMGLCL